jgi:GntR family transcriptional regulator/MocR family aminotransferase
LLFVTVGCTPRLTQVALADFIARGSLERHLRKARSAYMLRRDAAVAAFDEHMLDAEGGGGPAGLFVHASIPADEAAVLATARARGIFLDGVSENASTPRPPGLVVGSRPSRKRACGRARLLSR